MVRRAEQLVDTHPDSTTRLIDSVLRMPAYFKEGKRIDIALMQAEALFGDRGQEIPPLMDDEFFDERPFLTTSPELERAADYYARKKKYNKAAAMQSFNVGIKTYMESLFHLYFDFCLSLFFNVL